MALSSSAPAAVRSAREIGEFSEMRRRLSRGGFLLDRIARADGRPADLDHDGVTDEGYDVTVGIEHDFGALAPGAAVDVEVRIRWGFGAIDAILPAAMVVDAGPDRTVECEGSNGTDVTLAATASDAAASGWSWSVDGVAVGAAQDVVATLLPGRHVVAASAVDAQGRVASDEAVIEVEDTLPPIVAVGRAPRLWPPDHRMVRAAIPATATDACSDGVAISVLGVESDEPADRLGDGNTSPDWRIDADGSLWLRRERSGTGDGRTYTVRCVAVDGSGNTAPFDVRFDVPHDMGIAR